MGAALTQKEIFNAIAEDLKQLDIACFFLQPDKTQDKVFIKYLSYDSATLKVAEKLVGIKHEDFSISIDAVVLDKRAGERNSSTRRESR